MLRVPVHNSLYAFIFSVVLKYGDEISVGVYDLDGFIFFEF
jgi:hypothetical protein